MRQCGEMMNKNTEIGIKTLAGGATAPEGFVAGGVVCGVRNAGRRDLGLLFSDRGCASAAVFTRNVVKGAPLLVTREAVEAGDVRAVVANSGYPNAATGRKGLEDAREMRALAAEALGVGVGEVAVASTGVIGEHLPMRRISAGIRSIRSGVRLRFSGSSAGSPFASSESGLTRAARWPWVR